MSALKFPLLRDHSKFLKNLEDVTCAVCLEIYEYPLTITCGHTFCRSCLSHVHGAEPSCPVCRTKFDPQKAVKAVEVEKAITKNKGECHCCHKKMIISKLRNHHLVCEKKDEPKGASAAVPAGAMAKAASEKSKVASSEIKSVTNRFTFACPYCGFKNLDVHALRQHCNVNHSDAQVPVVCPICASMPWGDPKLSSSNFVGHLNLRHCFEYDTFVSYSMSDEEALELAIAKSLADK